MQLVIHAPFGSRINRAWGLALRKRFCRTFDFELQAAATDDAHRAVARRRSTASRSRTVFRYLRADDGARACSTQALLDAPMFGTRWRWNATRALALPRFRGGKRVPPPLQRMRAEDLIAAVFPDQIACQENLARRRARSPTTRWCAQTLRDCLTRRWTSRGWSALLARHRAGEIATDRARRCPSPRRSRTRS